MMRQRGHNNRKPEIPDTKTYKVPICQTWVNAENVKVKFHRNVFQNTLWKNNVLL